MLRNGRVCDGSGAPCTAGGIALKGDQIARVGDVGDARGKVERDVHGQIIAPGFVNMMSSAPGLLVDGRSQSDIRQGVTLGDHGRGRVHGPAERRHASEDDEQQVDIKYAVTWHTLGKASTGSQRGISPNVASFIGAATPRINVLGRANRRPRPRSWRGCASSRTQGDGGRRTRRRLSR